MELAELNGLVGEIATMRRAKQELKDEIERQRQDLERSLESKLDAIAQASQLIEDLQGRVLEALQAGGNKSWRTDAATVTVKTQVNRKVVDPAAAIAEIKQRGLGNEYVQEVLKPEAKAYFEQLEDFPGVEIEQRAYLSVLVKKEQA